MKWKSLAALAATAAATLIFLAPAVSSANDSPGNGNINIGPEKSHKEFQCETFGATRLREGGEPNTLITNGGNEADTISRGLAECRRRHWHQCQSKGCKESTIQGAR